MDATTLDRFRKILGLLGSDHDGERSAAALKATAMLKAAGSTWGDVAIGRSTVSDNQYQLNDLNMKLLAAYSDVSKFQRLLQDEQSRNRRLSKEIDELKRRLDHIERARQPELHEAPLPKMTKKRRRQKREEQEAFEEAKQNGFQKSDAEIELRRQIDEVLLSYDLGQLRLAERTEEFLRSVASQTIWTDRQREAVERTMQWVWKQ